MRIDAAVQRGRARAEERMRETIVAGRWRDSVDPATGDATRVLDVERYRGIAEVKYASLTVTITDRAAARVASQAPMVKTPLDAPILLEGDEVLVEASASDSRLVGVRVLIDGVPQSGLVTAHRYPAKELS